jgi:hypothetical protein
MQSRFRIGVIGHTGRGNYGHGLDTVWLEMPDSEIVAVADADPTGLAAAQKRPAPRYGRGGGRAGDARVYGEAVLPYAG